MDNDQLVKRVEWLDKGRREDKSDINKLKKKIAKLEKLLEKSTKHVNGLDGEISRLNVIINKVDKFEQTLSTYGEELKKELDAQEKRRKKRERDARKASRLELDEINTSISEFGEALSQIEYTKKEMKARRDEDERLGMSITNLKQKVDDRTSEQDRIGIEESLKETKRQYDKRIADLQAEVSAARKRLDEFGGKIELILADQRKIDTRLMEIQAGEIESREEQKNFIAELTLGQGERDRIWKDWSKRFDAIENQSEHLSTHLGDISDAKRDVEKARETFIEITDQLGRRLNEITEMQRLGEERFRQEYATFKADDQKRWTNYMLTQEELQRETGRRLERISAQTTNLEDTSQEMQDVLQHLSDQTEKRLQTMLENMRDWVAENERFLGSVR